MKGIKKCYIAFLTLFVLVAPFLLISFDVSAKQYEVGKIPLTFPINSSATPNWYSGAHSFEIDISDDVDVSKMYHQYALQMIDDNGVCKGHYKVSLPWVGNDSPSNSYRLRYGFQGFDSDILPSNFGNVSHCFYNSQMTNYDTGSVWRLGLPDPQLSQKLTGLLPYRFYYDGFYRIDSRKEDNGIQYDSKFDFHNLFGSQGYPNKISKISIPVGSAKSSVNSILTYNTPIEFKGEFVLDPDDLSQPFEITSNSTVQLETYYILSSGYSGPDLSNCTYSFYHKDTDEPGIQTFAYSCKTNLRPMTDANHQYNGWNSDESFPYFRINFNFDYINSNTKLFQMIYDSSIVITDNDTTSGGRWDDSVKGANTHLAPGSAYQNDYTADGIDPSIQPNFLDSLASLFNFDVLNPFRPLFDLFVDQNSCQQIPILAGMINSQETQVCPWFSANTRNIVTPVLGIASIMLLFGFIVRWLGARSGNFFEDSTGGQDFGSVHIGRRNKK